ncbi:dihydrolipoyl dehydrogenase family protein [Oligoflexus tunisiensis]|uniref:dihydrolipoyl dehydrogenase family protein n=1 Tax=Oligoflexus tunisiensis TaxID=708132 RepID=UPI000AD476D7|nr:FAD-dependent oxidoreductase [Oligoflexus tunisiensis]
MSANPQDYNMVVIGAGAAGLVSAYIAATLKAKVALIEKHRMGGDCLYTGCVPSKALIKTARVVHQIKQHRIYGIKSANYELDFADVMERIQTVIKKIEPHDSVERYTGLGVECIQGVAEVVDAHTVQVNGRTLKTRSLVLALGASPLIPKIPGLDGVKVLTSENLWDLRTLPEKLLVLGGGPIGCEMAQAFQRLGSQVTLVEAGPRLLSKEDDDVAALMAAQFQREGIRLLVGTKAEDVIREAGSTMMRVQTVDGRQEKIAFDAVFVAVGRRANTGQLDIGNLGLELNDNGTIRVDEYLRANGKNIYACGDVAGPYQFTHAASHQAWYCAVNALFAPLKKFKVDYRVIPWVTFTDPEIAQVGHNEQTARKEGLDFETTIYNLDDLDRAIAESEESGRIKVLTERGKDKIIGANIIGPHAGELLAEFTTAMKQGLGLNSILGTIHPYPTFGEANKYVAGQWKKEHAPETILAWLEKYQGWRR